MFLGGDGVEGRLGANAGYGCEVMKGAMRHPSQSKQFDQSFGDGQYKEEEATLFL